MFWASNFSVKYEFGTLERKCGKFLTFFHE
jgi:hypothetical protein